MKEKASISPSKIEKHIAGFDLEKLEITVVGSTDGKTLVTRGSEMKLELAHPKDAKESVLKKLAEVRTKLVKVSGTLREVKTEDKKTKLVLELAAVEPVEEKK